MMSSSVEGPAQSFPMVGVVQMTTGSDKESNWQQGKNLVERASRLGAQVIFIDREAREIIHLITSLCPSVCLFVCSCVYDLTSEQKKKQTKGRHQKFR